MSDPILGPAWPRLLAPGLLVWRRGHLPDPPPENEPLREYVVGVVARPSLAGLALMAALAPGVAPGVWLHSLDVMGEDPGLVPQDSGLHIDYRHPATLDHAARAVAAVLGWPVTLDCPRWSVVYRGSGRVSYVALIVFDVDEAEWRNDAVPALADIDRDDPDADRKAVRAVVAHVLGGAS